MTITVVFGDEGAFGGIDCQQAIDTCAITGNNTASASLTILEFADSCTIVGQNTLAESLNCQQRPDNCSITGIVAGVTPQPVPFNRYFVEIPGEDFTIEVKLPPIVIGAEP